MKKLLHVFPLLMAIVMMAMCPMKMWAYDADGTVLVEGENQVNIENGHTVSYTFTPQTTGKYRFYSVGQDVDLCLYGLTLNGSSIDKTGWNYSLFYQTENEDDFYWKTTVNLIAGKNYTVDINSSNDATDYKVYVEWMDPYVAEIGINEYGTNCSAYHNDLYNSTTITLYKGSEIDQTGYISDIAYNVAYNVSGGMATNELKIYMMMTDKTDLSTYDDLSASAFTLVYSGNPTIGAATGWENVELDAPFYYNDNTKNLLIAVCRKSNRNAMDLRYYFTYDDDNTRMIYFCEEKTGSGYDSKYGELSNISSMISDDEACTSSYCTNIQITFKKSYDTYTLEDGIEYKGTKADVGTLTYKRNFANTTYNALYVPFAMQYSDWSEKADVYRLLNIFENDNDDNGTIDEWVLKVVKLKDGESTKANTPYIIKPKAEGEMTLTLSDVLLAAAQEKSYWCASLDYKFVFTGTYAEKAIAANSYFFMSTTGGLQYAASDVTLKPQRWYMGIYDKETDALVSPTTFNPQAAPAKAITIVCDDEDTTTGISQMEDGEWRMENDANAVYNLSGQRLNAPKKGINIVNGKKVFVK